MSHSHLPFGSKPRLCIYCGNTRARTVAGQNKHGHVLYAHRRCIGPEERKQRDKTYDAMRSRVAATANS